MCTPARGASFQTFGFNDYRARDSECYKVSRPDRSREQSGLAKLEPKQLRAILADKVLPVCERANPSLNYIKSEVRGTAIYCVHSFYSQHSLSIGPLAGQLERFINEWQAELSRAGVKRVGVYGTGEFATSSYFDLK